MTRIASVALLMVLLGAVPASADETITATSGNRFASPVTTIDQGEKVTLRNIDVAGHDVTSQARGEDGRPLFSSKLISPGSSGPVEGTEYLVAGTYPFVCSVHPGMEATLQVTPAGQPVERPPDTTRPKLSVKVTSTQIEKVAERGRLGLTVRSDEAATVELVARAKAGGKRVKLGELSLTFAKPDSRKATVKLSRKARRALRRAEKAKVTVAASGTDTAGNTADASATRTLS